MNVTLTVFVILALAAFRITRLVTTDAVFSGLRDKIWSKFPPNKGLGYLITCNWCTGFWVSLFFVIALIILPLVTFVVSLVLAISAVIGLLSTWIER